MITFVHIFFVMFYLFRLPAETGGSEFMELSQLFGLIISKKFLTSLTK